MSGVPWLTLLLVVPIGTLLVLQPLPRHATGLIKAVTIAGALANAVIVAGLLLAFTHDPGSDARPPITFQFEEMHSWISRIGASYHIGIDGLSAWLLALDAGLFLLGAITLRPRDLERVKLYCGLLLLTETATMGVLLSIDLLLFYFFWEGMLIPLYLILGMFGDRDRVRSTLKFIVYTVAGSLLMLLAIIYIYFDQSAATGGHNTFDLPALILNRSPHHDVVAVPLPGGSTLSLLATPRQLAFLAFALAFAIKVPLFPFHTWLPDAYANAPASTLTFFAGIVGKLGAFALVRYGLTLFPGPVHDLHFVIAGVAIASIVYGALLALSQRDIKRIVAYSSISHLGFIVLGAFVLNDNGLNGSIIQMVNHGIIIASLFLIVEWVERRTGTRDLYELAGLERRMPWLYALFLVVTLAGLGLPGTNGFVGEFTIMLGAFQASWALAVLAGGGVILAAWYMLRLHQGLMHEPLQGATEKVADLRLGEGLVLAPLAALMIGLGLFPKPVGDVARYNAHEYVVVANGGQPTLEVGAARAPSGHGE